MTLRIRIAAAALTALTLAVSAAGQQGRPPSAQPGRDSRAPQAPVVISPDVQSDRRVTFRLLAPQAQSVKLTGTDIPGNIPAASLTKGENGVWELTLGPIAPGAYRYNFNVDGVPVIDPRNPSVSESNNNAWSLFYVPGADFMDTKEVPHGGVAAMTYYSTALKRFRRMHVYTPPGYELGQGKYPIFYLLHGAGDCDDSWTSVGRAGFIIDNLIAAGKARPMIVVMPAGHTSRVAGPRTPGAPDEFIQEFLNDIMPYAETHYRVYTDQQHRAIAGLSMGGGQTLNLAIPHADKFAYVGVYSSGLFGIAPLPPPPGAPASSATAPPPAAGSPPAGSAPAGPPPPTSPPAPSWEQQHLAELDNIAARKGLKLLWFSTGSDDRLMSTTKATVEMLKKHGFEATFKESPGGHTWINWRNYLNEFAPLLFQHDKP
jgi:enterochelin esterase family protein